MIPRDQGPNPDRTTSVKRSRSQSSTRPEPSEGKGTPPPGGGGKGEGVSGEGPRDPSQSPGSRGPGSSSEVEPGSPAPRVSKGAKKSGSPGFLLQTWRLAELERRGGGKVLVPELLGGVANLPPGTNRGHVIEGRTLYIGSWRSQPESAQQKSLGPPSDPNDNDGWALWAADIRSKRSASIGRRSADQSQDMEEEGPAVVVAAGQPLPTDQGPNLASSFQAEPSPKPGFGEVPSTTSLSDKDVDAVLSAKSGQKEAKKKAKAQKRRESRAKPYDTGSDSSSVAGAREGVRRMNVRH